MANRDELIGSLGFLRRWVEIASGIFAPAGVNYGKTAGGAYYIPQVDADGQLQVDVLTAPAVTGTVTANQGTAGASAWPVDSELPAAAALADGASNPTTPTVGAGNLGWNGSTWDRLRTAVNAATSTLTGLLNTIPLAIYNTSAPSPSNGQVVPLQADSAGQLKTAIARGAIGPATVTVATNATASDEFSLVGVSMGGVVVPSTFDGTQFTFQVASATGGTFQDLYDAGNNKITYTVAASRSYPLPPELFDWEYAKLVCVTTQTTTDTVFTVTRKG